MSGLGAWALHSEPQSKRAHLVGSWEGTYQGREVRITFAEGGPVQIVLEDPKTAFMRLYFGRWVLAEDKRPIALTIEGVPGLKHPLHTIVEFKGRDRLRLAHFSPLWRLRPVSFEPSQSLELVKFERSTLGD